MKSQLDSIEILVEAKSSLEKNLDHHKILLQEKEGKISFFIFLKPKNIWSEILYYQMREKHFYFIIVHEII